MRALVAGLVLLCWLGMSAAPAVAAGTARIQQKDGAVKTYENVYIRIANKTMSITSADHKGTLTLQKAACSMIGQLMRCYPYEATLKQHGSTRQIKMTNGTVWLNPGSAKEQLPKSSTQLPPRGVLLSFKTKAGTYVSVTGTIDELKK